jgi:2-hydroxy-3-keto-5-methylthiopentenyl-1-phosphate phosphatase
VTGDAASASVALILDFDGTCVTHDIGDEIVYRFAPQGRERLGALDALALRGEIDLPELQRRIWPEVRCTPGELLTWIGECSIPRAGLRELLHAQLDFGGPLVIASAGFDIYIHQTLGPLLGDRYEQVEVIANHASATGGGVAIELRASPETACPSCTVCKGRVVDRFKQTGHRVIYAGDGLSDRCALDRADHLFCVRNRSLHGFAREANAPHTAFDDFACVLDTLRQAWAGS